MVPHLPNKPVYISYYLYWFLYFAQTLSFFQGGLQKLGKTKARWQILWLQQSPVYRGFTVQSSTLSEQAFPVSSEYANRTCLLSSPKMHLSFVPNLLSLSLSLSLSLFLLLSFWHVLLLNLILEGGRVSLWVHSTIVPKMSIMFRFIWSIRSTYVFPRGFFRSAFSLQLLEGAFEGST